MKYQMMGEILGKASKDSSQQLKTLDRVLNLPVQQRGRKTSSDTARAKRK